MKVINRYLLLVGWGVVISGLSMGCGMEEGEIQVAPSVSDEEIRIDPARWFWQQVAQKYMRPRDLDISAAFLVHALQDEPQKIELSISGENN